MTIQWILPADFATTQKFVYNNTINYNNPFVGSLFNFTSSQNFYPQLPLFPTTLPKFDFKQNIFNFNNKTNTSSGIKISTNNGNSLSWSKLGYNAQKGLQLAQNAVSNAVGFTGYCARYVKKAISETGLGAYESGNACDLLHTMRNNKNFKEISPDGIDLKSLPAGCVLVYDKGVGGYSSRYGHTEITTGSGKAVSDGVTNNLYKKPSAIFMPVMA